jgi:chemosensory pili system protein ChpA (sensor histidine kinase/response regulator)
MPKIDRRSLIEFFKIESEEHFEIILNGLETLGMDNENWSVIDEIFRSAHTIKGSSAMVGFENTSKVAHKLENIFEILRTGSKRATPKFVGRILNVVEDIANTIKHSDEDITEDEVSNFIARLSEIELEAGEGKEIPADAKPEATLDAENVQQSREELLRKADEYYDKILSTEKSEHFAHVKLSQIDGMVNIIGELIASKNKEDARIKNIFQRFEDLSYATGRLNNIVRDIEEKFSYTDIMEISSLIEPKSDIGEDFSLGELDRYDMFNIYARQFSEIANDIRLAYDGIRALLEDYSDDVSSINKLLDKLRRDITAIRMVPVDRLFNTAIRAAKTAATIEGKEVDVLYTGEKLSIDQMIFDGLKESFVHLVRNSVSHGIELPSDREAAGKKKTGTLILRANRQGNQLIFEIEDDGSGIDLDAVRKKAVGKGLISTYEAESMRGDKLLELLFIPGFTTRDYVDDISGRGVGLDVVKDTIDKLGGYVRISTELGKGTKVILGIPVKELIAEYLTVVENGQKFSLPILNIHTTFFIDISKLHKRTDRYQYDFRGELLDIYDLGVLIKQVASGEFDESKSCIVLQSRHKKYIVVVDGIGDKAMTITKPLPHSLKDFGYYLGATIDVDGKIALIIDPLNLVKDDYSYTISISSKKKDEKLKTVEYLPNSILIVDDSLSVRKYLGKLLDSYGFNFTEATDGMSALSMLRERKFDLIITDLEMPMMNGYELINAIRNEMMDHDTPVFVLTSRATDKHRNKAMELGANDFIMKPFNDEEIIGKIKEMVGKKIRF